MTAHHAETLTIRAARDDAELAAAQELRVRVFCEEQGVPREIELDGSDAGTMLLIAADDGRVVATCRLRFSGETCALERMAVEPDHRRQGVGRRLLAAAEDEASGADALEMHLKAQLAARRFYERSGYAAVSEEIVKDAGIDHVWMSKSL